jgi:hypothetical protein
MAKKSMNMRVKSVKRERNKNKVVERTAKDEFKSFGLTLGGVLCFLGVCYLGVLGMQALGVFDKGYIAPNKGETEISHEFIDIGTVFNRDLDTYYVLFDDYSTKYTNDTYVDYLADNHKEKVYKVDMSKYEKYVSDTANASVQKVEDLKINGITLIKIQKGKNVKYITGSENIEEHLK